MNDVCVVCDGTGQALMRVWEDDWELGECSTCLSTGSREGMVGKRLEEISGR